MFSCTETSPQCASGKRKVRMAKTNFKNNMEKQLRSGNAKVARNGPSHQTCSVCWPLGLRCLRKPAQQLHHPVQQLQPTNPPDLPNHELPSHNLYNRKEYLMIPIPKKVHAWHMKDFRPVALISVLCKRMDRSVYVWKTMPSKLYALQLCTGLD